MQDNKRKRMRVEVEMPVSIRQNDQDYESLINNLSLKGMCCDSVRGVIPGADCLIEIPLNFEISIYIAGKIVRCSEGTCAIDFLKMDEQSFNHLRNLIRMHADNPDDVDEEISSPAF